MVPSSSRRSSVRRAQVSNAPLPMDARIRVEHNQSRVPGDHGARLLVVIERRQRRAFSLGLDEAAYLVGLLSRELPEVTVTRGTGSQ